MNILVTRPDERGQALVEALNAQGIFALHQPLFTLEKGRELAILSSILSQLNAGDGVFAVSKNAVDFAVETLAQTGFHFRADLQYFAVGQSTAAYFAAKAEQAVKYPLQSENSEGLLDLSEFHQMAGKNLIILRAESGRELVAQTMVARGAIVQNVECYRREPLVDNVPEKISLAKRVGVDTILVTSGEILSLLCEQTAAADQEWLRLCRLIVVSKRIAHLAQELGWAKETILIVPKADNQTVLEAILNTNFHS